MYIYDDIWWYLINVCILKYQEIEVPLLSTVRQHIRIMTFEALDVDEGIKNGVLIQLRHRQRSQQMTRVHAPKILNVTKTLS